MPLAARHSPAHACTHCLEGVRVLPPLPLVLFLVLFRFSFLREGHSSKVLLKDLVKSAAFTGWGETKCLSASAAKARPSHRGRWARVVSQVAACAFPCEGPRCLL